MHVPIDTLRQFLTDGGLVQKKNFDTVADEAVQKNRPIGELLVEHGEISDTDLRKAYSHITGVTFVSLLDKKITYETLSMIPEPVARHSNVIAIEQNKEELVVAMLDTDDLRAIDFIKKKTGLKIITRLTDTNSIKEALKQYQRSLKADLGDLINQEASQITTSVSKEGTSEEDQARALADQIPAVKVVDALLKHAVTQGASDIHIEHHEEMLLVRYRIDGILHDAMTLPKVTGPSVVARIKVLSNMRLDEKRLPQDGRFKIDTGGEKVAFRVSTLPTHYGEKIVMRLLREGGGGYTLEGLGFHGISLERVHDALKKSTGIILITGPTGSGKTTTLYTLIDILNTPEVNISTIEDPVEYQMARINQTQVRPEIGLTFSAGLRTLMRQDPDVIMIGEIRDTETASLAINAALTGHLVLATLHTNSAAGAVPRLIDMGVEPFLLVSTLQVVIAQRLVRTLHKEHDRATVPLSEITSLEKQADLGLVLRTLKDEKIVPPNMTMKDIEFGVAKKSNASETGFSGRKSIIEVLSLSPSLKDLIAKSTSADAIHEQSRKEGMLTMMEDGIYKAAAGQTTLEEVLRVISE
ncbi:MAG: ATPase, T2SS/T4P/T4SS family [Minisyncoccia bacterium]